MVFKICPNCKEKRPEKDFPANYKRCRQCLREGKKLTKTRKNNLEIYFARLGK